MQNISPHPPTPANDRGTSQSQRSGTLPNAAVDAMRPGHRPGNRRPLTTEEFAAELGMSAQSIRKRYSQTGSYFDVRPVKLPNRRLLWPANALEQLIDR